MYVIKTDKGTIEITQQALFGMIDLYIQNSGIEHVKFLGFKNKQNINTSIKKGFNQLFKKEKEENLEENSYDVFIELAFEVTKLTSLTAKGQKIQEIVTNCLNDILDLDVKKNSCLIKVYFEKFNESSDD